MTPLNLADLYLDILVSILSLLRPAEVVTASKVCRSLRAASKTRIVWLEVTLSMMEEHGILSSTYSLVNIDTTTLKHIATSPTRLSNLIKSRAHEAELFPVAARVLLGPNQENKSLGIKEVNELHSPYLFPGGRFVFIMSDTRTQVGENKTCVQLWDLGIPGLSQRFELVAGDVFDCIFTMWTIIPDGLGSGYYIIASGEKTLHQSGTLFVYLFDPNNFKIDAKPINQLATNGGILDFSCYGTKVVAIDEVGEITAWDYKSRLAIRWKISSDMVLDENLMTLQLVDSDVFIAQKGYIFQWRIPELLDQDILGTMPRLRDPFKTFSHLYPSPLAPSPPPSAEDRTFFAPPCPWIPASQAHIAILDSDQNFGIYHMSLDLASSEGKASSIPTTPPSHLGSFPLTIRPQDKFAISELRKCDESFIFCFDEKQQPAAIHVTLEESTARAVSVVEVSLLLGVKADYFYHSLCTATGRMIFVTTEFDLFVVDYLQGPSW